MSLCEQCYAPGACCRRFQLYVDGAQRSYWSDDGVEGIKRQLDERGLPFVPIEKFDGPWVDPETGRPYEQWSLSCPRLGSDGRCTDYENRPELCREFEPASGMLCVHWRGAEGVDLTTGEE